jgi:hypothetical protein
VIDHGEQLRARPLLTANGHEYRYEREVEEFLRWSPHVRRRDGEGTPPATTA